MGGNVGYIERHEAPSPSLSSVSDDPSDASLTAAWQTGDKAAFGVLFQRHADSLFDYCHRRCGDREVAEDLVQQAFLEAWRQRHSLVISSGSLRPWLFGVARNLLLHEWRRVERGARSLGPNEAQVLGDPADAVIDRLDAQAALTDARARLNGLPDRYREPPLLWAWDEMTNEDIALILDLPIGTVKSRLARARRNLSVSAATVVAGVPTTTTQEGG